MGESHSTREAVLFIVHLGYASLFPKAISFSLQPMFVRCIKELMIVAWGINLLSEHVSLYSKYLQWQLPQMPYPLAYFMDKEIEAYGMQSHPWEADNAPA